ncbi:hypothetical protein IQ249_13410 [Lusitaniella coriacea LEGE 07157]|uniref:Minimal CRISPR polymerase domain-containing protein n=1 Tax=Lusitaniella coriacea LEGE 07157 TaxID=945747 RepID=A0A8J7J3D3_9CYAN|nr:hypothetical protein [Lusitaniella coriacea]MBE9116899.1 hypothetical protein [Lusitaniella coriacea LEGE 07157]
MQIIHESHPTQSKTFKYAFFDGDNIGISIENLLNNGKIKEASRLSESIKFAIFKIESFIHLSEGANIIISGGDDILIKYDSEQYNHQFLEKITQIFSGYTGLSMSCGVGKNISQAINNLMIVKQTIKGSIKIDNCNDKVTKIKDMTETKLYIFTTSEIPDPYINVIAHCKSYYENISQAILIEIIEDKGKINRARDKLDRLKQNIKTQISSLLKAIYLKKDGDKWESIDIEIDSISQKRYGEIENLYLDTKVMFYQELEEEIDYFLRDGDRILHIFDVTAVLKSYLVDLYMILRSKKISTIYSFELFKRTYDHRDLIHNQEYKKTYDFVCLANTIHTKDRIVENLNVDVSIIEESSSFTNLKSKLTNFLTWMQNGQIIFSFFSALMGILLLIIYPKLFPSGFPKWVEKIQELLPSSPAKTESEKSQ